jgi:prevent-host-death family protein
MIRVGTHEAKTHLSELLGKVAEGEEVLITRCDAPVARIVPVKRKPARPVEEVIEEIREFRNGKKLGDVSLREMMEEGRK